MVDIELVRSKKYKNSVVVHYYDINDLIQLVDELTEFIGYESVKKRDPVVIIEAEYDDDDDDDIDVPEVDYHEPEPIVETKHEPEPVVETKHEPTPEFPDKINNRDLFLNLLNQTSLTSLQNYSGFWDNPIWNHIKKFNEFERFLTKIVEQVRESDIQKTYKLFTIIFKFNDTFKLFNDQQLKKIQSLFTPIKASKHKVAQKKTTPNAPQ